MADRPIAKLSGQGAEVTLIRPASDQDAAEIQRIHLMAFPTSAEADLVDRLLANGDAVISLVAEDGDEIVGHVLLSRMTAEGDGHAISAVGLAPVAVVPDRQAEGIGSQLIEAGLRAATAIGTEIVFLVGEPDYYRRFGFAADTAAPFASPYAGKYFQAKVLRNGFILPASGLADYAPAFAELA